MSHRDKDHPFSIDDIESTPSDSDATTCLDPILKGQERGVFGLPFAFFQWKSFFFFVGCCCLLFFQWMYTSDLFYVPQDVAQARLQFMQARERYMQQRAYWDMKFMQYVTSVYESAEHIHPGLIMHNLHETSPELWIAYLVNRLRISPSRLEQIAIFPIEGDVRTKKLIVSKYEPGIWPLQIMLSLELVLQSDLDTVMTNVIRIRRGSQDIASGLSWAYFGGELESLQMIGSY